MSSKIGERVVRKSSCSFASLVYKTQEIVKKYASRKSTLKLQDKWSSPALGNTPAKHADVVESSSHIWVAQRPLIAHLANPPLIEM
ncbi:10852_t:CDS:2 [Entrophospora sp. SA101]|nr:10852_t:CDS:2 [Entrophospora sp. SA101]